MCPRATQPVIMMSPRSSARLSCGTARAVKSAGYAADESSAGNSRVTSEALAEKPAPSMAEHAFTRRNRPEAAHADHRQAVAPPFPHLLRRGEEDALEEPREASCSDCSTEGEESADERMTALTSLEFAPLVSDATPETPPQSPAMEPMLPIAEPPAAPALEETVTREARRKASLVNRSPTFGEIVEVQYTVEDDSPISYRSSRATDSLQADGRQPKVIYGYDPDAPPLTFVLHEPCQRLSDESEDSEEDEEEAVAMSQFQKLLACVEDRRRKRSVTANIGCAKEIMPLPGNSKLWRRRVTTPQDSSSSRTSESSPHSEQSLGRASTRASTADEILVDSDDAQ
eukprot:TRINITY_DN115379_c0_g1_i1.p1 TRINITY_DN115379_c0_g1~~TRINITY_DN115379_c0_g1_i1.p1  ORF type:complete len:343 (-),score=47.15 TRINITY_DN115379_c0_g1_i1:110-1138(-)